VPNAPSRVLNIPGPPRNQVYVAMEDRLTGRFASVDADVETRDRGVEALQGGSLIVKEAFDCCVLVSVQVEPTRNMTFR